MAETPYTDGLHRLTAHTYAYLRPPGTWGFSNCGLVVDGDEALLVDTQFDLPSTRRLLDTVASAVPGARISTVVTTHANGDHCWGNQLLPDAVVVGSGATAEGMAEEISPQALSALSSGPAPAAPDQSALDQSVPGKGAAADYMRRFFGEFDFGGIVLTPPTQTFSGEIELRVGGIPVRLMEVGPAHTTGDVIVHVPDQEVLYAGDILFIGDHPVMWSGPVSNWVAACERIVNTGARFVVPGHGPVTDIDGVRVFRDYLSYLQERAEDGYRRGIPFWAVATELTLPERYAGWGHRERLVMNFAVIYRGLGYDGPSDLMTVLAHTAEAYRALPSV